MKNSFNKPKLHLKAEEQGEFIFSRDIKPVAVRKQGPHQHILQSRNMKYERSIDCSIWMN